MMVQQPRTSGYVKLKDHRITQEATNLPSKPPWETTQRLSTTSASSACCHQ
jgi:hypothetical protein